MVTFLVAYLFFLMLGFIALPLYGKVGIPALTPFPFWRPLWRSAKGAMIYVTAAILVLTAIIAAFWFYVIPKIPKIFGLRKKVKKMSPFREYQRAGVFALLSNLRQVVFSGDRLDVRLIRLFMALGQFMDSSSRFLQGVLLGMLGRAPLPSASAFELEAPSVGEGDGDETGGNSEPEGKSFTPEEERQIQDEYQQCMEESMVPMYMDDPPFERTKAMLKNNTADIMCQSQQLKSSMNLLSFR